MREHKPNVRPQEEMASGNWFIHFVKRVRGRLEYTKKQISLARLRHATISKREFISDLKRAIEGKVGYAAGKNGHSEQYWMYYEIVLNKARDGSEVRLYEKDLEFPFLKNTGIFPMSPDFVLKYNRFYIEHVRNLDCLGIFIDHPRELEILKYYELRNKLIHFVNQEPDRSRPDNPDNCYLQYFRDKKLLLVCPFAGLLKERATKEIFEGVWSKTGKKWFYPKSVDALEFPYGFSPETHKKYKTAIDLFEHIASQIANRDFDVALIGAAGLAIPIASHIKSIGKVGIDLGGHLQILFGVIGERWQNWESWKRDYFNDWWINMPDKYKPNRRDVGDYDYW